MSFIEPGTNGQTFPDGNLTGYANFTINKACTNKTNITLNTAKNLSFLENACGKLKNGDVLTIDYTLLQPNTGSFLDWSQLCVDGYNSSCGQVHCFQEPVQVTVGQADYSIDITGNPRELSSCIAFNLTINLNKNSPDDDPKWIGHDMNLTFNDSNYRYVGHPTNKGDQQLSLGPRIAKSKSNDHRSQRHLVPGQECESWWQHHI